MNKSNSTIPEGYTTITPWIISPSSVKLIEFMNAAFDAVEIVDNRAYNADGSIGHMEARIGTAIVMLFDSKSHWFPTRAFLRIFVDDSQAIYDKAMKAGAISVTEVTKLYWGDKVGRIADPFGNIWWIQEQGKYTNGNVVEPADSPDAVDAMSYVQRSLDEYLKASDI